MYPLQQQQCTKPPQRYNSQTEWRKQFFSVPPYQYRRRRQLTFRNLSSYKSNYSYRKQKGQSFRTCWKSFWRRETCRSKICSKRITSWNKKWHYWRRRSKYTRVVIGLLNRAISWWLRWGTLVVSHCTLSATITTSALWEKVKVQSITTTRQLSSPINNRPYRHEGSNLHN